MSKPKSGLCKREGNKTPAFKTWLFSIASLTSGLVLAATNDAQLGLGAVVVGLLSMFIAHKKGS